MDDIHDLIDQIAEWERLASLTRNATVFNGCCEQRVRVLNAIRADRDKYFTRKGYKLKPDTAC